MTDNNYQAILDLIKEISGQRNIISLPRIFLKVAGDVVVGLFLSQCVWYSDKGGSHDGWFYKSNKEWQEELGLSYAQVKRATAKLEGMSILQTKLKKAKGAPTTHYYVDMEALTNLILDFLEIRQDEGVENQESLKTKDLQESEKSLTALTPSLTDTTLKNTPQDFNLGQHDPLDGVPRATDGHQQAVDRASGGSEIDPIEEIVKHLRWLCVGRGAKMPRGSELRGYRKAARQLLEEKINTDDWQSVCEAIDDWSEHPPEVDIWQRERTKKPQVALDCIAAHYWQCKNGGNRAKNRGQRSRSGVQGSRTRPGYKIADLADFGDSKRLKAEIHAGGEPDGPT